MLKKICSAALCAVLVIMCAYVSDRTYLAATQQALVTGTAVGIRADATISSARLTQTPTDKYVTVTVTGTKQGTDNSYLWYAVVYNGYSGYIREDYIKLIDETSDPDFETQLAAFPESYKPYLRKLHASYPNWEFRADKLTMSFSEAAEAEEVWPRKLVNLNSDGISWRSMASGAYDWSKGEWNNTAGGWTGAAKQVIEFYTDPRNYLDTTHIYAFLQQSYDSTQTLDGINKIIAGTFLENGYSDPDDTAYGGSYANIILEAAKQSGVSAYVLASTVILEQGRSGSSDLISGTTSYGKYFNFFNFSANGDEPVKNGLEYAAQQGWTTRSAAIIGGAKKYANGYISAGQDTYYYKDFDLLSAPYYTHQYAQSIYDAYSSAALIKSAYSGNYDAPLIFRIPVFTDIPDTAAIKPEENDKKNNHYITSMTVGGNSIGFSMYTYRYTFSVSGNTTVDILLPNGASIITPKTNTLQNGTNVISVTVMAETGYTKTYTLNVTASTDCILTVPLGIETGDGGGTVTDTSTIKRGDVDGNGKITINDLTEIQKHILGMTTLTGNKLSCADVDGNEKITINDLTEVQKHILGMITIQ